MNKTVTLTALIGSLLLGACTTHQPAEPTTRQTLEGEVRLGTTESGRASPYQDAQAAGRTLTLHPVTTAENALGAVLTRTTVAADLWYILRLPNSPTIPEGAQTALLGAPNEDTTADCETSYTLDNPDARTMRTTFQLDLPDADEALALNPWQPTTADGPVQRTSQLVYANADVREQYRTACDTLVGREEVDSDLNLKRGWNVVVTQETTTINELGFVTTWRKTVTDDLTHHLVLAQ